MSDQARSDGAMPWIIAVMDHSHGPKKAPKRPASLTMVQCHEEQLPFLTTGESPSPVRNTQCSQKLNRTLGPSSAGIPFYRLENQGQGEKRLAQEFQTLRAFLQQTGPAAWSPSKSWFPISHPMVSCYPSLPYSAHWQEIEVGPSRSSTIMQL